MASALALALVLALCLLLPTAISAATDRRPFDPFGALLTDMLPCRPYVTAGLADPVKPSTACCEAFSSAVLDAQAVGVRRSCLCLMIESMLIDGSSSGRIRVKSLFLSCPGLGGAPLASSFAQICREAGHVQLNSSDDLIYLHPQGLGFTGAAVPHNVERLRCPAPETDLGPTPLCQAIGTVPRVPKVTVMADCQDTACLYGDHDLEGLFFLLA